MPTNYKTVNGDSPRSIAAKFYGDRSKGFLIQGANPGLKFTDLPITTSQTLLIGQDVIIPDQVEPIPSETPETQKTISLFDTTPQKIGAADEDEVAILINGNLFRTFDNLQINFAYDKIAAEFTFDSPFDPDVPEYRDAFRQKWQATSVFIGGKLVVPGQSWATPNLTSNRNNVMVKGYSKTGSIEKSALTEPFEFEEGTTYAGLITDIASRMGLAVVIDPAAAAIAEKPFEKRISFSPTEAAGGKLISLARERGLILSPTFNGRILVTMPKTNAVTIQALVSGERPALNFTPQYNADALHTSYIGYAPDSPDEETEAGNTIIDGYPQPGIIPRIKGIVPRDTDNQNIEDAIRAERGRAFAAWFALTITVAGWRDRNGNLYQPNNIVTARAPRAMIYEDTALFIRAVSLRKASNNKSTKLDLILPEALTGKDLKIKI